MTTKFYCTNCGNEMPKQPQCLRCNSVSAYWNLDTPEFRGPTVETIWTLQQPGQSPEANALGEAPGVELRPLQRAGSAEEEQWFTQSLQSVRSRIVVAELVRRTAPGDGSVIPLWEGENHVGTRGAHEVLLEDPYISNPHAILLCSGTGPQCRVKVTDLDSKNSTYVNGEKITKADALDSSVIRFANVEFVLRVLKKPREEPSVN